MSKGRKFYLCLSVGIIVVLIVSLLSWGHYKTYRLKQRESLEWASSFVKEFETDVLNLIKNRSSYNRRYSLSFEECFSSSDEEMVRLIAITDPLFRKETTETILPNSKFQRISPVVMTDESYLDCINCHRHQNLKVGDFIGGILTVVSFKWK